ncbi:hypothetical protein M1512_00955 [Patescibacteria group bacterium]|nr:hypothetical protein [Patescibacteria group bacterium]
MPPKQFTLEAVPSGSRKVYHSPCFDMRAIASNEGDHEANAAYIAATIIAKSEVGKPANYSSPDKPPMQ